MRRIAHMLGGLACVVAAITLALRGMADAVPFLLIGFWFITSLPPNPPTR